MMSEFDFLTQETVRLTENLDDCEFEREFFLSSVDQNIENQNFLDQNSSSEDNDLIEAEQTLYIPEEISYPESTGLIFNILWAGTTVSIRGIPVHNIAEGFDRLADGDSDYLKKLRITTEQLDTLFYFECDYFEQAQMIGEQLFLKRFPIEEDLVCNISDPGFSWWYIKSDKGFRVNFKNHKLRQDGDRIKLGPIGDVVIAAKRLGRIISHVEEFLPVEEVTINDKYFSLDTTDYSHPIIKEMIELFELGYLSEDAALLCELPLTERLYLLELAAIRRFWIALESIINKTKESLQ